MYCVGTSIVAISSHGFTSLNLFKLKRLGPPRTFGGGPKNKVIFDVQRLDILPCQISDWCFWTSVGDGDVVRMGWGTSRLVAYSLN